MAAQPSSIEVSQALTGDCARVEMKRAAQEGRTVQARKLPPRLRNSLLRASGLLPQEPDTRATTLEERLHRLFEE